MCEEEVYSVDLWVVRCLFYWLMNAGYYLLVVPSLLHTGVPSSTVAMDVVLVVTNILFLWVVCSNPGVVTSCNMV